MSTPPGCEFVYFDGRGLGEIIRLTLAAADIPFTEVIVKSREQFLGLLPELQFCQVPLLRIDGLNLVQSRAIVRYIARKANMMGTTEQETARMEELFEGTRDAYDPFVWVWFHPKEVVKADVDASLNRYLPIFNQILEASRSGFLVGAGLTLADIGLLELLLATDDYCGTARLRPYLALEKFRDTLKADARIRRYVDSIRKPPNTREYTASVTEILQKVY